MKMIEEIDKTNKDKTTKGSEGAPKFRDKLSSKSAMLHTYKQDVESLVRKRKISLVSAMAAQSDKREDGEATKIKNNGKTPQNSTTLLLIASILMFVLGSIAIFVAYTAYQQQQNLTKKDKSKALLDNNLIFIEHKAKFNVTDRLPREILAGLAKALNKSQATLGSITKIELEWDGWNDKLRAKTKFIISQKQLIQLLGLKLPEQFTRLLGKQDKYMVGMHMADRNSPFIILTVQSYEYAFASMLEWEKVAERELDPFFYTPGSLSTKRTFSDLVVQNIDTRVSRDEQNNIKLLYSFLDKHTLLITNNIHTLTEISRRYKARQGSKSALDY